MSKLKETKLRLEWARKVLTSENLIIITDEEGLMRLGVDPDSIDDVIAIAQYRGSLTSFRGNISQTIKELDALVGDIAQERGKKDTKSKAKKIPVKQA